MGAGATSIGWGLAINMQNPETSSVETGKARLGGEDDLAPFARGSFKCGLYIHFRASRDLSLYSHHRCRCSISRRLIKGKKYRNLALEWKEKILVYDRPTWWWWWWKEGL